MPPGSDKKEAILETMLDLIAERGFHNAPMSVLAKRSGASPGVIYHYFPSKDDLIHALYQRVKSFKLEVVLSGYSESMTLREAYLHFWLNAYSFYRTHLRETRFLDQYLSSPYCEEVSADEVDETDPGIARLIRIFRPRSKGGRLSDLPQEAIDSLSFGLAANLAKSAKEFSPATLKKIAEASWTAIAGD
ncbi:TetR/AcrR family transcriptional regulator [Paracidobacterium acidisoli]|nr:TetR/AcrR family transcriptional regulator [Paracidobacterium acidisoli]MBT9330408.1 TetR/AcrR family transcriptional regulator [Paracidobacterium acidisoli]